MARKLMLIEQKRRKYFELVGTVRLKKKLGKFFQMNVIFKT